MNRPGGLTQRLAAELRAELARRNKSRRWLAGETGHSHATVARWLNAEVPISLDALESMCQALGLTIGDLLRKVERGGPSGRRRATDRERVAA